MALTLERGNQIGARIPRIITLRFMRATFCSCLSWTIILVDSLLEITLLEKLGGQWHDLRRND